MKGKKQEMDVIPSLCNGTENNAGISSISESIRLTSAFSSVYLRLWACLLPIIVDSFFDGYGYGRRCSFDAEEDAEDVL
jgi:hypothetical protein